MNVFSGAKDRVVTGIALLVAVLFIGIIDNFFVMYVVLGVIYLLAFKEALKLFDIWLSPLHIEPKILATSLAEVLSRGINSKCIWSYWWPSERQNNNGRHPRYI